MLKLYVSNFFIFFNFNSKRKWSSVDESKNAEKDRHPNLRSACFFIIFIT